jgi:uncharacterized protein (DUF2336 family)
MAQSSIILELERAIESHDSQRRTAALSSVADLFKSSRIQDVNDERLELFDDLFAQLVKDMTTSTLAKLSNDLSHAKIAPVKLVQQLAKNDAIEVAHSILTRSNQVSDETLLHIAKTKGQEHLEALAGRAHVNEAVSDLLIERGNERVIQTVTANANARISERGFGSLTERFSSHEKIAVNIAMRQDVPPHVMKTLLTRATDTVRAMILDAAPPEMKQALSDLLKECLNPQEIQSSVTRVTPQARKAVIELKAQGKLREEALMDFAKKRMFGEAVVSLALMSAVPAELVESQMFTEGRETIIIICKSINLKWTTVIAILCLRETPPTPTQVELARNDYMALSVENALRAMRFFYAKQSILKR